MGFVASTINNVKDKNYLGAALDFGKAALTAGASVVNPALGAAVAGATGAASTAIQGGGGVKESIKTGVIDTATTAIGAKVGAVQGPKVPTPEGVPTGGTASINTGNTFMGSIKTGVNNIKTKVNDFKVNQSMKNIQMPNDITGDHIRVSTFSRLKTDIAGTIKNSKVGQTVTANANKDGLKRAGAWAVENAQGILAVVSAGMGMKQGMEGNKIAQQGLLFQQQTYAAQEAEKNKYKATAKATADANRQSLLDFGSSLKGLESNSTLLTDTSTGNTGVFSILNTGITTSRKTDLT